MKSYLKVMRLERWPRSLAIFVGVFFYILLNKNLQLNYEKIAVCSAVAFALSLIISIVNYIINEIADAPFDSQHPTKKDRPLVKGEVSVKTLAIISILLLIITGAVSFLIFSLKFNLALFSLFIAALFYNIKPIRLKDVPYLDSISESINNPIRFLIGWFAVEPVNMPPLIVLAFWWLFGNFLLSGKRMSEWICLGDERAKIYRKSFAKYSKTLLVIYVFVNGAAFFVLFVLFSFKIENKFFHYSTPLILFFLVVYSYKVLKVKMLVDEPEILAKNIFFLILFLVILIFILLSIIV